MNTMNGINGDEENRKMNDVEEDLNQRVCEYVSEHWTKWFE